MNVLIARSWARGPPVSSFLAHKLLISIVVLVEFAPARTR